MKKQVGVENWGHKKQVSACSCLTQCIIKVTAGTLNIPKLWPGAPDHIAHPAWCSWCSRSAFVGDTKCELSHPPQHQRSIRKLGGMQYAAQQNLSSDLIVMFIYGLVIPWLFNLLGWRLHFRSVNCPRMEFWISVLFCLSFECICAPAA